MLILHRIAHETDLLPTVAYQEQTKRTQLEEDGYTGSTTILPYEEFARRYLQENLIQERTGLLPLPLLADEHHFKRILDIGCGAGQWVMGMAYTYPQTEVVGIERSETLVGFAQLRANAKNLTNAAFFVADARNPHGQVLRPASFDLIHMRFAGGWLLSDEWKPLLSECHSLLSPRGLIVLTEAEGVFSNAASLTRLYRMVCEAMYKEGRSPSNTPSYLGIAPCLGSLLAACEYKHIGVTADILDCSRYTTVVNCQCSSLIMTLLQPIAPFLLKTGVATQQDLDTMSKEVTQEMFRPDFYGIVPMYTFYAEK